VSARLLDAEQAADLLGLHKSWVMEQARRDAIPHVRLGRYVRFSESDLLDWIGGRRRGPDTMARDD
jgi:excisionase family DNA binding protein